MAAKKPGGQPKNTNALKHGFYSRSFRTQEAADLLRVDPENLDDEIRMLKVVARRMLEMASDKEITYADTLKTLTALGVTSTRIATLMRTKSILTGEDNSTTAAISAALSQVIKEIGIK
jgi:hypothetical protein